MITANDLIDFLCGSATSNGMPLLMGTSDGWENANKAMRMKNKIDCKIFC